MSSSSTLIRLCSAPAIVIAFYRLVFTCGLAGASRVNSLLPQIKALPRRDLVCACISGVFLGLHLGVWITSLSYTSISSSVLFTNMQVLFVLVFSFLFLKEKIRSLAVLGIIITLAGSGFIGFGDLRYGRLGGDALALLSGLFVAVYYIIGRYVRPRVDLMVYTFVTSLAAAIALLVPALITQLPLSGFRWLDWLLFVLMAIGPGLGGHAMYNWALKYVKAPLVSVSVLGESAGASILGYLIFHEALLWYQWAGGALILTGIYLALAKEVGSGGGLVE
jgi:drug/metabolite transporter (DMT)-like permease